MGYDTSPKKKKYSTKPLVEYLRSSIPIDNNQPSFNTYAEESTMDSNYTGDSENIGLDQSTMLSDDDDDDNIFLDDSSDTDYIPEQYDLYKKPKSSKKSRINKTSLGKNYDVHDMLSEENLLRKYVLPEFIGDESEIHGNMLSKQVQTDLTMVDLDNLASAFKASVAEVNRLKSKLKLLSRETSYNESFEILLQN